MLPLSRNSSRLLFDDFYLWLRVVLQRIFCWVESIWSGSKIGERSGKGAWLTLDEYLDGLENALELGFRGLKFQLPVSYFSAKSFSNLTS